MCGWQLQLKAVTGENGAKALPSPGGRGINPGGRWGGAGKSILEGYCGGAENLEAFCKETESYKLIYYGSWELFAALWKLAILASWKI